MAHYEVSHFFNQTEAVLISVSKSVLDAVNVICFATVQITFDQTMDVGFKARELFIEVTGETQVINDALIETLTWNQ